MLFFVGNVIDLVRATNNVSSKLLNLMPILNSLFEDCRRFISAKASNIFRFHVLFGWYSGPILSVPSEFYQKLAKSISYLWSRPFISLVFQDLLKKNFENMKQSVKRPSVLSGIAASSKNCAEECDVTLLCVSTAAACSFFMSIMSTITHSKSSILNSLSWTPSLAPQLWHLLNNIPPNGLKVFDSAPIIGSLPMTPILLLFCEMMHLLLLTLDEEDIHVKRMPLSPDLLSHVSLFLNQLCFRTRWRSSGRDLDDKSAELNASALKLLSLLYDRWYRHPFTPLTTATGKQRSSLLSKKNSVDGDDFWIIQDVANGQEFLEKVKAGNAAALRILTDIPHCVPFPIRVDIFRQMIARDRSMVGDASVIVTIRRKLVLEDGFRFLSKLTPSQWKQVIRVKFINEFGLPEIGIDQNGVFKEFLEDICKTAFAANFSLFRTTEDGNCVPSLGSVVHENHLQLLEFVGKVFAKALYEGIIIDIPFATFVYAKLIGRMNFLVGIYLAVVLESDL
jgi:ubiquitin-protein ligase E3 B